MLIRNWMSRNVLSVTPDTSMMKASKLLEENHFTRMPVVDKNGHIVGIISHTDLKEAAPSKATTLDTHELHYLLAEIKVSSIMTKNVITAQEDDTIETVALAMQEHDLGGMPVVDGENRLVGMITDKDIFKVLLSITGAKHGGVQFSFLLPKAPNSLRPIIGTLRENHMRIISILSSEERDDDMRQVYVRIRPATREAEDALIALLQEQYPMTYWVRTNTRATQVTR